MTNRECFERIMHGLPADRLPVMHFGFWGETLQKWVSQGYLSQDEIDGYGDGNDVDKRLTRRLGFDCNYEHLLFSSCGLNPFFEEKVVESFPDGTRHVMDGYGVVRVQKPGTEGIPAEVSHLLCDRASWEEHYKPRFQWSPSRVPHEAIASIASGEAARDWPLGIYCGSLLGHIRDILGVVGMSYMMADDPDLLREIIDTVGDICYRNVEEILKCAKGIKFDFAHFWEDICFKNGPLVNPSMFREWVGPHYRRITGLLERHGIDIVSVDCDGSIDLLAPVWLENGVNTMFPIEVGTWGASIHSLRGLGLPGLRGIGGMDKRVFAADRAAVDAEVERLVPLIAEGRYIPCPDHRIPPDAKFENVVYYAERLREASCKLFSA